MNALFELDIVTEARRSRQISGGLHAQLRTGILEGRLRPGAKLPSTRSARTLFGVSRNTLQEVYDRLTHEGLVVAHHGSGTFVADPVPSVDRLGSRPKSTADDPRLNDFWLRSEISSSIGFWRESEIPFASTRATIDLRPAPIDPRLFPFPAFRQVMARQLRRLETRPAASRSPQWNQGNFQLRHGIADHVALTRAVACEADEVIVTSGAQQAFDLIARILVKAGQTIVAVEDPGFPPMRVPFAAAGAQLAPVRVDSEGIVIEDIPKNTGIICVCPSHQFPLGMPMSAARRQALLQYARHTGAVIVEDDYDGEFRYDGTPLHALRNAQSSDLVFYVGSFSKCMLPSLRLGFVIPPAWAMRTLVAAKNALDWHCSVPLQMAVAGFIKDGHLARHVRRLRRIYRARRDHLLDLLRRDLNSVLVPISSSYGLHVTATAAQDIDTEAVSEALARRGILCHALTRYFMGPETRSGFVMSYASADAKALDTAVAALAEELASAKPVPSFAHQHLG
jgi:GntR family transcriptional regulator / MocR family aminotransferase